MVVLRLYESILRSFAGNDQFCFTVIMSLCHSVPLVIHELFLFVIHKRKLFQDRLLQPGKNIDPKLVQKSIINTQMNHFFFTPLLLWLAFPYLRPAIQFSPQDFPTLFTVISQILIFMLIEDFLFYWSHRALHTPILYRIIHKKHHEFKVLSGYSLASEYTHPIESLFGNIIPTIAGPVFTTTHLYTLSLWIIIRMFKTCDAHSGYCFQWSPFGLFPPLNPSDRHDFHHETGLGSYGTFFLFWDTICGTDEDFLKWRKEKKGIQHNEPTIRR
jgi:sterol desaturase/sphingolipid hydroxylase (fatty acid hydroxylase superfamily)